MYFIFEYLDPFKSERTSDSLGFMRAGHKVEGHTESRHLDPESQALPSSASEELPGPCNAGPFGTCHGFGIGYPL